MTFYGLEQPVEYGPQSFFDPAMAQMVLNANNNYINAVYQDYLRTREDLKEFNEKYGDFTSGIEKDMESYYGEVDKVRNAVNRMYANGDLLRTQEGRVALGQIMNSVNRPLLAQLRQSAKEWDERDKTIRALKLNDKYNEDFARWQFRKTHKGINPEDWDTAKYGTLGTTSVDPYKDLNTATKGWYDDMTPGYIGTDPNGYELWGNTEDDVRKVMSQHLPDLQGDYWDYQRYLAKQQVGPNATPEQIQAQLENNLVAAAAEKYTRPTLKESEDRKRQQALYYKNLDQYDLDLNGVLDDNEREYAEQARTAAMLQSLQQTDANAPMTFMDKRKVEQQAQRRDEVLSGTSRIINHFIQYNQQYVDKYESAQANGKTKKAVNPKYESVGQSVVTPYGVILQPNRVQVGRTVEEQPTGEKYSAEELSRMQKDAKTAQANIEYWKEVAKNPQKAIKDGWLNPDGSPTQKMITKIFNSFRNMNKSNSTLEQRRQRVDELYSLFQGPEFNAGDGPDADQMKYSFLGNSKETQRQELKNSYIEASINEFEYTPVHRANVIGMTKYPKGSLYGKFQTFLKNNRNKAIFNDDSMRDAFIPNKNGGGDTYAISGRILISEADVKRFFDEANIKDTDDARRRLQMDAVVLPGAKDFGNQTWYSIPVTKIVGNSAHTYEAMNTNVNKGRYGGSKSRELAEDAENDAYQQAFGHYYNYE